MVSRIRFVPFPANENLVQDPETSLVWHRSQQRVPYADTDRANVVYHANYLRYFEVGRTELLRHVGYSYRQIEGDGFLFPVVDARMQFVRPLRYDDAAWIHTRPGDSDGVRFTFEYLICHADTGVVSCVGSTSHCTLNPRWRPIAMEAHVAELWRTFPTTGERPARANEASA